MITPTLLKAILKFCITNKLFKQTKADENGYCVNPPLLRLSCIVRSPKQGDILRDLNKRASCVSEFHFASSIVVSETDLQFSCASDPLFCLKFYLIVKEKEVFVFCLPLSFLKFIVKTN